MVLPAAESLASTLLVTVLTLFLLIQRESMRDRLLALAVRRGRPSPPARLRTRAAVLTLFLLLQASTNAAVGAVVAAGLYLLGVPYAPLWGLLTAALRFVPYIGIWVSALFPFALAVAVFPGWGPALGVLALYGIADGVMSNAVETLLFGLHHNRYSAINS